MYYVSPTTTTYTYFIFLSQDSFFISLALTYPFTIAPNKLTLAAKKFTDANHTNKWTGMPCISRQNAEPSHVTTEAPRYASDIFIFREFHCILSEHRGSKHRYQVKYCAVMTLLWATKRNVCTKSANDRSYGATPRLT